MADHTETIRVLNKVLKHKLTAINQYFLHARMHGDQGFEALNKIIYKASIQEMIHADHLIERVLFLKGLPNLQELGKLYIGESIEEMLEADLNVQAGDIGIIRDAIAICESQSDFVSRELLEEILEQQEEHWDWLDTQLDVIEKIGLQRYLKTKIEKGASS